MSNYTGNTVKLCKDCKHYANGLFEFILNPNLKSCSSPHLGISLMTGKTNKAFAEIERSTFGTGCSREAKYWEKR